MLDFLLEWGAKFVQSYGTIGLFIVMIIGSSPIPIPVEVIALGVIFLGSPPLITAVFASIGATIGAWLSYLIGQGIFKIGNINKKQPLKVNFAKKWLNKYGIISVFFFALFPIGFDAIALAAGGVRMNVLKFLLPTLLGRFIRYNLIFHLGGGFIELMRQ
jgi:membrane protein YqaA with SNARE-associated domain|tara:strand:+ start:990 stop:1469 length:480 start_codon:yes stop_codon:yes gene_type:complete